MECVTWAEVKRSVLLSPAQFSARQCFAVQPEYGKTKTNFAVQRPNCTEQKRTVLGWAELDCTAGLN